jgi:hypothetical protein
MVRGVSSVMVAQMVACFMCWWQAVTAIATAIDVDAEEFSAQLVTTLAALAHTMGTDPAEPDWWRILDALLLVTAHPTTGSGAPSS